MAIVSYSYYTTEYLGEYVSETDFPRYDLRAESLIQQITKGATKQFEHMPADIQEAVKNAICSQIEYYSLYGIDVATTGIAVGGGFTVGKVSVQNGAKAGAKTGASGMVCPAVMAYLEQTGLLNPQVDTAGKPFLWWT